MAIDLVLTDAIVLTMDEARHAYRSGYVWMRDGRIHEVGPMSAFKGGAPGAQARSMSGHLIMPALVNCHTHLSNGILRGFYDEMPLDVWIAGGMWNVLRALDRPAAEAGAALSLIELMTMGVGTTAVGEFGNPNRDVVDGVLAAVQRSGVRAVLSRMTVDSADESSLSQAIPKEFRETPDAAVREVERLRRAWNSDRISVVPEALGILRCTPHMVKAMHELAVSEDMHFLMHIASSQEERDESRRRLGHGSITELHRLGCLGPKTLLAHCVWLDDGEVALLAEHGTGVSHNPVSNISYAAGEARLKDLIGAGVRVGLGVDGASTNNGQNVWETMKMAMFLQKQMLEDANFGSAELALELMTIGGARALHLEHEIGSLEHGKRADVIALDTARVRLTPAETLVSNLVYSNDPEAVRSMFVDGAEVVRDGRVVAFDTAAVVEQANTAATRVLRASGLDRFVTTRSRWTWID